MAMTGGGGQSEGAVPESGNAPAGSAPTATEKPATAQLPPE